MTGPTALLVVVALASSPAPVPAAAVTPPGPVHELRYNAWSDGLLTVAAGTVWFGTEAFKSKLAPTSCRLICETEVNAFDTWGRQARWAPTQTKTAATISDALDFAVLPLTLGGLQWYAAANSGAGGGVWADYLLILEAASLAQVMNQGVKFLAGRERPFWHAMTPAERAAVADPYDNTLSFYSGHSTFAFALTVAAGTVAELRGYKDRWLIWAIGLPLAASVPYFRMAADKHYLSDVLVGSAIGAAFGVAIPLLHGRANPSGVALTAAPGGFSIGGTF